MSEAGGSRFEVRPGGRLSGRLRVPGDKSISHRAVMLGALADGDTRVRGFLPGEDTRATVAAFRRMGVDIEETDGQTLLIHGVGLDGLAPPDGPLDLGNAGTGMRLIAGALAGQRFAVRLVGDASLMQRPMERITTPLARMGVEVGCGEGGRPPLDLPGTPDRLRAIEYRLPMASAQVKSCVLLAGLYADGPTCVVEPAPTRDHTERMLEGFGVTVKCDGGRICVVPPARLAPMEIEVPADISSATFPMVGALIAPGSDLVLEGVGINPTRDGVLEVLRLMGARIDKLDERTVGAEPVADLRVRASDLDGIDIPEHLVPLAIDEFPAILIAAARARGTTRLTGARELRVKESDRIAAMADGLTALGVTATSTEDGIVVEGGGIRGGRVESRGDHRIAMAFAMAGLVAGGPVEIADCDNVRTSFPGFVALMRDAGLAIEERSGAR